MKTSFDIRKAFLTYFEDNGHTIVPSAGLIPHNDPTLLFTNAGMVQFKGVFLGEEDLSFRRAASSQKCMRAGGKHNDLENVGRTARHHTFFEMLGNFSFGDYFKAEAVAMAWECITGVLGIDPARLWVTVHEKDDEAYGLWRQHVGVAPERIVRMGDKDNFWSMGETGPCGPCSEILIDQGEGIGCGRVDCRVGCECDRFLELWNLVFMQYNRDESGIQTPLPHPSIDTGMGLERITAAVQGAPSNYATDIFAPLIACVEGLSGKKSVAGSPEAVSTNIIADHARAIAFLVADGVMPSNEGRGYVLRRIMRRAARHGRLLGVQAPFLKAVIVVVADQMQEVYPEVKRSIDYIEKVVEKEERSFSDTLDAGLKLLEDEIGRLQEQKSAIVPGQTVFKLYDTYGFPCDLTADIAGEKGMSVDREGFDRAMQEQRLRARQAWKGSGEDNVDRVYKQAAMELDDVVFSGYDRCNGTARIERIISAGVSVQEASSGETVDIITESTPFYGTSGGQKGDTGSISGRGFSGTVIDTLRPVEGIIAHRTTITSGSIAVGDSIELHVDANRRRAVAMNHTATHLLHAELRALLGRHVKQAGSLVAPERLRFDFSHFEALARNVIVEIENRVNERVRENTALCVEVLSRDEALSRGATALFGEKYGEQVRCVSLGDYSMELCGGTHVPATGAIGLFKIIGESAVAAGVRRIEALTGTAAIDYVHREEAVLADAAEKLKTDSLSIIEKIEKLLAAGREKDRHINKLKQQLISGQAAPATDAVQTIAGISVLTALVDAPDPKELRAYGDAMRDRLGSGIVVCGSAGEGKAHLLVMVTKDISKTFSAGDIVREIAPLVGGKGGGRKDLAQAGGKNPAKLREAIDRALTVIAEMGRRH